ncbi:unnamed protein product, partial [marine sediment metagenome]
FALRDEIYADIYVTRINDLDPGAVNPVAVRDSGALITSDARELDFGTGLTVSEGSDGFLEITSTGGSGSAFDVRDTDALVQTEPSELNFINATVTSNTDGGVDIDVGGSGGTAFGPINLTDTTPTLVANASIPADDCKVITASVRALDTSSGDMKWWRLTGGVKYFGGTASVVDFESQVLGKDAGAEDWVLALEVNEESDSTAEWLLTVQVTEGGKTVDVNGSYTAV